jgi:predicted chitinase
VEIVPTARTNGLDREWQCFLKTCHDYEIAQHNVKNRLAAFLMNVTKESGELYYIEEIADGWDYEWPEDLGNTQQGDGPRYKGHGYIQTTGRLNHRKVGEAKHRKQRRDEAGLDSMEGRFTQPDDNN